ncbi:MAG: hypothetical protein U0X91_25865 [Spirosomataceae bacterium]
MQRRPFIKLLGSSLSSLPFLPVIEDSFTVQTQWEQWLNPLISACQIETVHSLYYLGTLPAVPTAVQSGEFIKTGPQIYFYKKKHYCFQVFEKKHPSAGVLELLIPFWKRAANEGWEKVACWSLYDLKALAEAVSEFSAHASDYLLPLQPAHLNSYLSAKGQVELISYVQSNGTVVTNFRIMKDSETIGASGSVFG